jgi:hypothetical protein
METNNSFSCLQQPAIYICPESDKSNIRPPPLVTSMLILSSHIMHRTPDAQKNKYRTEARSDQKLQCVYM